jgi:hypothetical protein
VCAVALLGALDGAPVASADALACNAWLSDLKKVQGWIDSFRAQVTARLDTLAADGESFGSEATHTRCSGMSSRDAAKEKERARALGAAAGFTEALSQGAVTGAHVDQLAAATATLPDEICNGVFERADELLDHATHNDPGRFGRHVRDLARKLERDAGAKRDEQQRASTYLNIGLNNATGMYDVRGSLHPELGAKIKRALDAHVAAMVKKGEAAGVPEFVSRSVNRGRLAADALGEMIAAGHGTVRPTVADISVLVDDKTLATGEYHDHTVCETADGAPLPASTVRRLICNAFVTGVVIGQDGTPLDVGRTTRTANRRQRRALRAMYRTCAAEGCDTLFDHCEIHHIWWWEHGGPSDLDNFLPLCAHHHHLVHALGWRLHLAPDRTLTITDRHGVRIMVTTPDMPHPSRTGERRTRPAPAGDPDLEHPSEQQPALLAS